MGKFIDLTGQRFGKLKVIKQASRSKVGTIRWLCQCDCGNKSIVQTTNLTSGHTKSCGCLHKENRTSFKDLTGQRFGRLTVIKEFGKNKHGRVLWLCKCTCCNYKVVPSKQLLKGYTKSCGCLNREAITRRRKPNLLLQTFGRLTVFEEAKEKEPNGATLWWCVCSCEEKTIFKVRAAHLLSGATKSCGCYAKDINSKRLKELSKRWMGETAPNWRGGISFEPYCHKFNNRKKEEIRDKYGRKCIICGKTEEENGRKLAIHHVDYDKMQGCDGKKWELVPLCASCHAKTNGDRDYWADYIRKILVHKKI